MRCYVELIGRLSRDPDIQAFENGDRLAILTVATEETWRDRQSGERRVRTTWHTVRVNKAGVTKAIERDLRLGALVFVKGGLRYSEWIDAAQTKRKTAEIVVKAADHEVLFLDAAGSSSPSL